MQWLRTPGGCSRLRSWLQPQAQTRTPNHLVILKGMPGILIRRDTVVASRLAHRGSLDQRKPCIIIHYSDFSTGASQVSSHHSREAAALAAKPFPSCLFSFYLWSAFMILFPTIGHESTVSDSACFGGVWPDSGNVGGNAQAQVLRVLEVDKHTTFEAHGDVRSLDKRGATRTLSGRFLRWHSISRQRYGGLISRRQPLCEKGLGWQHATSSVRRALDLSRRWAALPGQHALSVQSTRPNSRTPAKVVGCEGGGWVRPGRQQSLGSFFQLTQVNPGSSLTMTLASEHTV